MFLYKIKQSDKEVEFYHSDNISKQDLKEVKPKITYIYDFEDFSIESEFPIDFDSEFILLKKHIQRKESMYSKDKDSFEFIKSMFGMK